VGGVLSLVSGGQFDDVAIFEANVGSAAVLNLGNGENFLDIENAAFASLTIVTGKHDDLIDIGSTDIRWNLTVVTGGGNDSVFAHEHDDDTDVGLNSFINTGAGNDFVEVEGDIGGSLTILTGDGSDGVDIFATTIGLNLTINTGNGNDNDDVPEVGVGGDGGDAGVVLNDVNVGFFAFIYLGAGNDTLDVVGSQARRAYAYGGPGTDRVTIDQDTLDALDFFFQTQFEEKHLG